MRNDHINRPSRPRLLLVFGTRPEAIKMLPVYRALAALGIFDLRLVVTAQHRALLDQILQPAGIVPDVDLDLMTTGQSLDSLAGQIITQFGIILAKHRPARILVHGDTLTAMAATIAAYLHTIPVAHVEAGLRSGNLYAPWPEEGNRRLIAVLADLHFAPTPAAAAALRAENIPAHMIHMTGNTVIDALLQTREAILQHPLATIRVDAMLHRYAGKRLIAVTCHRRENHRAAMRRIAHALLVIAQRPDIAIFFPLHPNPQVQSVMRHHLSGHANIILTEPLDYPHFVRLLMACDLILTDSGGVQEEAPSLGKPILVLRNSTERPESVTAGNAMLVGTDPARIIAAVADLLDDDRQYRQMAHARNPYGDGQAAKRIAAILASTL